MQVHRHGRTQEQEQHAHRLTIECRKIDGFREEAEGHRRLDAMQNDGVPDMRQGNATADAGRAQRLTSEQNPPQALRIDTGRQGQSVDDSLDRGGLVAPGYVKMHTAASERLGERR